jgi:hypothetical protein
LCALHLYADGEVSSWSTSLSFVASGHQLHDLDLTDNGARVTVRQAGLYWIYAQVEHIFLMLPPYILTGFNLTTDCFNLLGGRRR